MSRPDLTEAQLERWAAQWVRLLPDIPPALAESAKFQECFLAGCWLEEALREAGCDDELEIERICFANGQRQVHAEDPWVLGRDTLSRWARGDKDEPGAGLASGLLAQRSHDQLEDDIRKIVTPGS